MVKSNIIKVDFQANLVAICMPDLRSHESNSNSIIISSLLLGMHRIEELYFLPLYDHTCVSRRTIHWVKKQANITLNRHKLLEEGNTQIIPHPLSRSELTHLPFHKHALLAALRNYTLDDGTPIHLLIVFMRKYQLQARLKDTGLAVSSREGMLDALLELRKEKWIDWYEDGEDNTIGSSHLVRFTRWTGRSQREIVTWLQEGHGMDGNVLAEIISHSVF
ncbi:hypothetical protein M422DRAFT_242043 [Sphaerobolus stellatus SS14]|nr:hypothetical protein M422DRAFT_242043 [Sphaerobolus stellatus SS14]